MCSWCWSNGKEQAGVEGKWSFNNNTKGMRTEEKRKNKELEVCPQSTTFSFSLFASILNFIWSTMYKGNGITFYNKCS